VVDSSAAVGREASLVKLADTADPEFQNPQHWEAVTPVRVAGPNQVSAVSGEESMPTTTRVNARGIMKGVLLPELIRVEVIA
jgi:hypothetical protein